MIRLAHITRTIKSFLSEVKSIGGVTQNRFISPKGIYSKPTNENAIMIGLSNGTNQDIVIALQKDIDLQDNDVYLTDDKNYIHFKFKDGIIEIQGDTVFNDNVTIKKTLTANKIICTTTIEAGQSVTAPTLTGTIDVISGTISGKMHTHDETGIVTLTPK